MKNLTIATLISLSVLAGSAQGAVNTEYDSNMKHKTGSQANLNKDGEIVAVMTALNKNEIAVSQEALNKHVKGNIEIYSKMLNSDHSKSLQDITLISQKDGIQPSETQDSILLTEKGKQELNTLKPLNEQQFQIDYINAMVKGHSEALAKIDGFLLVVKNPDLKKYLQSTRVVVSDHLDKAKQIQNELR